MRNFKLFVILLLVCTLLSGCNSNDNNKKIENLKNEILLNEKSIDDLKNEISNLQSEITTMKENNNSLNEKDENYTDLKNQYEKLSKDNKSVKTRIDNINSEIISISNKQNDDIFYITFVGKGTLRTQYSSSVTIYNSQIVTLVFNKNYDIKNQLSPIFHKTGPWDSGCNRNCWLNDLKSDECIDFSDYNSKSSTILYSACLNEENSN